MATTNQRNKQSGRHNNPQKREASQIAEASHEEGAFGAMREEVSDYMSRGATQIRDMTRDHEGTAVLVALAAGFGVGLLIGAALAPTPRRKSWGDRLAAEGIGRRMLERVESMIPDAITDRLGR